MCRYRFLCELITHTLYFCYLFSFLLFLSFFSLHFFWFLKSNIHNKCGIWSHLRKGCYKRISCPKFEFVMYFKNSWFLEKIFLWLFHRYYEFEYASEFRIFDTEFMCRSLSLCELITHTWYFFSLFSFLLFLFFFSFHFSYF